MVAPQYSSSLSCFPVEIKMNIHCHIPKLYEFAIDLACDDVVEHGTAGLIKPMPLPLYLKCQVAFAHKYGKRLTIKKLYDLMRANKSTEAFSSVKFCSTIIVLVDHTTFDDAETEQLYKIIGNLMEESEYDVAGVIECLHRFASRCVASAEHKLMMDTMSYALKLSPCRSIRQVLIQYGGHLDANDFDAVVRCGMSNMVKSAIGNGHQISERDMENAIASGDIETIMAVANAMPRSVLLHRDRSAIVNMRHCDVSACELLLSLGLLKQDTQYSLYNLTSVAVLQWFHDHNLVDLTKTFRHAVAEAPSKAQYREILYYLVEILHLPVPSDILNTLSSSRITDLGVCDYLLSHGADINAVDSDGKQRLLVQRPELLRYWIDKGLKAPTDGYKTVKSLLDHHDIDFFLSDDAMMSVHILKMAVNLLHIDLNVTKDNDKHMTLLHTSCSMLKCPRDKYLRDYEHDDRYEYMYELGYIKAMRAVSMLLQIGASPNVKSNSDYTPLHCACRLGNIKGVVLLLDHGADPNFQNIDGFTSLHYACRSSNPHMVQLLLNHHANTQLTDKHGRTALHVVCTRETYEEWRSADKDSSIINMLVKHGVDVDARDKDRNTALHTAIRCYPEVLPILLNCKPDINIVDNNGQTVLHMACNNIHDPTRFCDGFHVPFDDDRRCTSSHVKELIKHGANVNAVDNNGNTALHYVCDSERYDGWKCIASDDGSQRMTPFTTIAKMLIKKGADVNAINGKNKTSLQMLNYHSDHFGLLCVLLESHATASTDEMTKFLFRAIDCLNDNALKVLLTHGADVNAVGNHGRAALAELIAASIDEDTIGYVRMLIAHGANDTSLDNDEGIKLLRVACLYDVVDAVRILIGRFNNDKWTGYDINEFLDQAIDDTSINVISYLVEHGGDVELLEYVGDELIHAACAEGLIDLVKILLSLGCDVSRRDAEGHTPLDAARGISSSSINKHNKEAIIQLLLDHDRHASSHDCSDEHVI